MTPRPPYLRIVSPRGRVCVSCLSEKHEDCQPISVDDLAFVECGCPCEGKFAQPDWFARTVEERR